MLKHLANFVIVAIRYVYDYCTNVNNQGARGNAVTATPNTTKAKKSQANGGAQFVGHELYKRLKEYLKSHLIDVLKVTIQINVI